ncbi:MAG: YraN family protein [Acetatifactor sp.]|nr:YraN family protein [Acetatifactor sp.]
MNTRATGGEKEELAAKYLETNGMHVVERNYRNRVGEIDLIGYHDGYLVFVEVKFRKTNRMGSALEAVNYSKQLKICKVADFYRYSRHVGNHIGIRYDVVAIQGEKITWVKNAFQHISVYY